MTSAWDEHVGRTRDRWAHHVHGSGFERTDRSAEVTAAAERAAIVCAKLHAMRP